MNGRGLLTGLRLIPMADGWSLTPVDGNKAAYRKNWQGEAPISPAILEEEIRSGRAKGYGLRLGETSFYQGGFLLAVDFDGPSSRRLYKKLSGGENPPHTVAWTSGKEGREQLLFCVRTPYGSTESYRGKLRGRRVWKSGAIGPDGKEEQLEFRYNGCQSVLPPSVHPETGNYTWINHPFSGGSNLSDWEQLRIPDAPQWMIDLMLETSTEDRDVGPTGTTEQPAQSHSTPGQSDSERALAYLSEVPASHADDYDSWIKIGMALHSVGDDRLLQAWDQWSQQSAKYKPGDCERKWKSFKRSGIALGSLIYLAGGIVQGPEDPWRNDAPPLPSRDPKRDQDSAKQEDWATKYKFALKEIQAAPDLIHRKLKIAEVSATFRISKKDIEEHLGLIFTPQRQAQLHDLEEFMDSPDEALDWVVPGWVPKGEILLLSAAPKVGKTLLAYEMAYSVAEGSRFLGELGEQCEKGRVLIIQCDESPRSTKVRLRRRGFDPGSHQVKLLTGFNLEDPAILELALEEFRPDLLIIDSLRAISAQAQVNENSAEYSNAIYKLRNLIGSYATGCILIHHDNKGGADGLGSVRGSTSITGAVWGIAQLRRKDRRNNANGERICTITPRDGEGTAWELSLITDEGQWKWETEGETSDPSPQTTRTQADTVLEVLENHGRPMTAGELELETGIGSSLRKVLARLVDRKQITRSRVPQEGSENSYHIIYSIARGKKSIFPGHGDTPQSVSENGPEKQLQPLPGQACDRLRDNSVTPPGQSNLSHPPESPQTLTQTSLQKDSTIFLTSETAHDKQSHRVGTRVRVRIGGRRMSNGIIVAPPPGKRGQDCGAYVVLDGEIESRWVIRPNIWTLGSAPNESPPSSAPDRIEPLLSPTIEESRTPPK